MDSVGLQLVYFQSFLYRFSNAIFDASWLDFPPQLASPNPWKSIKNRCQEALHLGLQILIDFGSIFDRYWFPSVRPSETHLALAGKRLFDFSALAPISIKDPILVPTCLHLPPKINQTFTENLF